MLYPYWSSLKNNEMGVADKLNKAKKYVVSTSLKEASWENSIIVRQNVIEEIRSLRQQEGGNILVQGSATLAKSLLEAGLVDELKLLIQPHIMGTGRRFFSDEMNTALKFIGFQQLEKGVVILSYNAVEG
jgi:dihydrofolate reductase